MLALLLVTDPVQPCNVPEFVAQKPQSFDVETVHVGASTVGFQPDIVLIDGGMTTDILTVAVSNAAETFPAIPIIALLERDSLDRMQLGLDFDDFILAHTSPVEAATRFLVAGQKRQKRNRPVLLSFAGLTLDENNYSTKYLGQTLDLTFREFELLRYFMTYPGRVFTRAELLQNVWGRHGDDFRDGTVTVHVRRLREKMAHVHTVEVDGAVAGVKRASLKPASVITTVRNVGYRFDGERESA